MELPRKYESLKDRDLILPSYRNSCKALTIETDNKPINITVNELITTYLIAGHPLIFVSESEEILQNVITALYVSRFGGSTNTHEFKGDAPYDTDIFYDIKYNLDGPSEMEKVLRVEPEQYDHQYIEKMVEKPFTIIENIHLCNDQNRDFFRAISERKLHMKTNKQVYLGRWGYFLPVASAVAKDASSLEVWIRLNFGVINLNKFPQKNWDLERLRKASEVKAQDYSERLIMTRRATPFSTHIKQGGLNRELEYIVASLKEVMIMKREFRSHSSKDQMNAAAMELLRAV